MALGRGVEKRRDEPDEGGHRQRAETSAARRTATGATHPHGGGLLLVAMILPRLGRGTTSCRHVALDEDGPGPGSAPGVRAMRGPANPGASPRLGAGVLRRVVPSSGGSQLEGLVEPDSEGPEEGVGGRGVGRVLRLGVRDVQVREGAVHVKEGLLPARGGPEDAHDGDAPRGPAVQLVVGRIHGRQRCGQGPIEVDCVAFARHLRHLR